MTTTALSQDDGSNKFGSDGYTDVSTQPIIPERNRSHIMTDQTEGRFPSTDNRPDGGVNDPYTDAQSEGFSSGRPDPENIPRSHGEDAKSQEDGFMGKAKQKMGDLKDKLSG